MHALETGIVRRHAIVLQARYRRHALLRHVLLSEHYGQLLGTVVAVVEENHHVAFLDSSVDRRIVDSLHKFVGHAFVVRLLHGSHHIRCLLALAFHQKVVSLFHTLPTLVAVHGVETADDGSDDATRLFAFSLQLFDETLTAFRVGVAAVHETMHVSMFDAVSLGNAAQREQMIQRGMHTTGRGQSHQMHALAVLLGIFVGRNYFGILQDAAVGTGTVNFHQILIHDTACADIEVTHLGIPHLSVGQSHVLTRSLQLRHRIILGQIVHIRCRSVEDYITLAVITHSPTVENH